MREEKRILAILSFPEQCFLLTCNQFWSWLRRWGRVGRTEKAARGLAVAPIPETRGGCRGAPSELPLSLTPALGARVPLSRLHAGTAPTARSSGDPQRRPTWGLGLRPELPTAGGAVRAGTLPVPSFHALVARRGMGRQPEPASLHLGTVAPGPQGQGILTQTGSWLLKLDQLSWSC